MRRHFKSHTHEFALAIKIGALLLLFAPIRTHAASPFGEALEQFVRDNVKFGGFVENTTGLAISHGSHFFDTANRFDMNRFTIQPEFNVNFRDDLTSFISWRFVKEPRYSMESKSRKQSVAPPWNEKIRLSLIDAIYGGRNKFKSLAAFDKKDSFLLGMSYQFLRPCLCLRHRKPGDYLFIDDGHYQISRPGEDKGQGRRLGLGHLKEIGRNERRQDQSR